MLFLDNAINEKNTLEYSILEKDNDMYVRVRADYLEDHFNEIEFKHSSGTPQEKIIKLNFNSREGLPYLDEKKSGDNSNKDSNYDFDYQNDEDSFDIFPMKFKHRKNKDYEIVFKFYNVKFDKNKGDYLLIKDFYGNVAKEAYQGLIINEVNFQSGNDQDYNYDGFIDENDDFIEIVNKSKKTIDISEYKIYDEEGFNNGNFKRPKFVVPERTYLYPGQVYLILNAVSGATKSRYYSDTVFLKTQSAKKLGANLNIDENALESIILTNKFNGVLDIVSNKKIEKSSAYSLGRNPVLTGSFKKNTKKATPGKYVRD